MRQINMTACLLLLCLAAQAAVSWQQMTVAKTNLEAQRATLALAEKLIKALDAAE